MYLSSFSYNDDDNQFQLPCLLPTLNVIVGKTATKKYLIAKKMEALYKSLAYQTPLQKCSYILEVTQPPNTYQYSVTYDTAAKQETLKDITTGEIIEAQTLSIKGPSLFTTPVSNEIENKIGLYLGNMMFYWGDLALGSTEEIKDAKCGIHPNLSELYILSQHTRAFGRDYKNATVWIDSLGCGFDFEEKRAAGKHIMANYEKDAGQTIIVTHELEVLDQLPVSYWMILDDTHQVYSMKTANSAFKDFMSCGLNNHNLFTDEMYM